MNVVLWGWEKGGERGGRGKVVGYPGQGLRDSLLAPEKGPFKRTCEVKMSYPRF